MNREHADQNLNFFECDVYINVAGFNFILISVIP